MFFIVSVRASYKYNHHPPHYPCITPVAAHQLRASMLTMLCVVSTTQPPITSSSTALRGEKDIPTYLQYTCNAIRKGSKRSRGVNAQLNAPPCLQILLAELLWRQQNKSHACVVSIWTHSHRCNTKR